MTRARAAVGAGAVAAAQRPVVGAARREETPAARVDVGVACVRCLALLQDLHTGGGVVEDTINLWETEGERRRGRERETEGEKF